MVSDEADNGIQLWYLPFEKGAETPVFRKCAKHPHIDEKGYVLYYTNQCPFNAKYVPVLEETAGKNGIPFKAVKIESREDAQNAPTPITTYLSVYGVNSKILPETDSKEVLKRYASNGLGNAFSIYSQIFVYKDKYTGKAILSPVDIIRNLYGRGY